MIESIHACVDLLHVGYRVKDAYDPIILNVYHCLKMENLNDEQYMLHIDSVLNKSIHDLNETEVYTYITYVFEKENYVPSFLKSVIESGMFKELLLRYLSLKESDTLQCVKLNRNLLSKWHYASISEEDAFAILEAMASLDLETKEVEENGWQLRMYKNVGGKNRLVKTIVHDEKNPKGFNEWIRSLLPFVHLFVFGGSYYSWEK